MVIVGIVERKSNTAIGGLIVFLSTLNDKSFTMIKLHVYYMESGGFGNGDFEAVSC